MTILETTCHPRAASRARPTLDRASGNARAAVRCQWKRADDGQLVSEWRHAEEAKLPSSAHDKTTQRYFPTLSNRRHVMNMPRLPAREVEALAWQGATQLPFPGPRIRGEALLTSRLKGSAEVAMRLIAVSASVLIIHIAALKYVFLAAH
jgi:hypothetical protein